MFKNVANFLVNINIKNLIFKKMKIIISFALLIFATLIVKAQSSQVYLQSIGNGKYVTVIDGKLIASSDNKDKATVFYLTSFNRCFFKTQDGKCIVLNEKNDLIVSEADECLPEPFISSDLEGDSKKIYSKQTVEGKYVCTSLGLDNTSYAGRGNSLGIERFIIIYK